MTADAPRPDNHTRAFGRLLRTLRAEALLSQEQLAARSGLGVRTIRDLEAGRVACPRGKSVRSLSSALGLTGEAKQEFEVTSRMPRVASLADRRRPALRAVVGDRPHVTLARQPVGPAATEWTVPAQLPMDTPVFAGRKDELARLDAFLERAAGGSAVVVAALFGGPGVGKTALAVHWTHRVSDRFPDGQLYVDLRGFDQHAPLSAAEAVRGLLGALGVPTDRLPADLHAQTALYRSLLHGRRMLVLLDNARDGEQVRALLPGAPGSLVVVTSRRRLTGLIAAEGAHPLTVGPLPPAEARELMARRLGRERTLSERAAVDEIIERCARLPLAMALSASRAAAEPNFPLAAMAEELREARGGLDAFGHAENSAVRNSFALSYNALGADAARLLTVFGAGRSGDLVPADAAVLAGLPERRVRVALDELTHGHLIVERRPGHFGTHELLRAYAAELT